MRLAGSDELYEAIEGQTDQVVDSEYEKKIEAFLEAFARLKEKGFDDNSAQFYAEEMATGREPMAKLTPRFAAIYGTSSDTRTSSEPD